MITTLATLGFPFAVRAGFTAVFIMRVLQGISTALSFPATGLIPSQWSTIKATGTFIAILSCHVQVLQLDVTSTGFATALPHILSAIVKFVVGPISDRATCIPGRWRLIFFAAFSQGMMATCILLLAYITNPSLAQAAYTAAIVFSGINVVGIVKCAQLVARQHAHFVMSVISLLLCAIILLIPVAVNIVCPDNTPEQWSHLFLGISIIVVVANAPFAFVARSDPAPWTGNKVGFCASILSLACSVRCLQLMDFLVLPSDTRGTTGED
ncbi:hypothetical protein ANCDUO_23827 [Ancylostoma duodenale]|uniref:Major facilitator superfamily (MFS) profile domain-containing protein n=1 Tax=Ancylostoma duodenale TaxID=51022 RepID=A0A0C2C8S5_9BILA|nr:hypothetical protein ANCDUO_23827 [Ancylostoma duodenale]